MALADLIARLERDATARAEALLAAARHEAARVLAETEGDVARRHDADLASRRLARRERLGREVALARERARVARLRAEHALVDRVLERAAALAGASEREATRAWIERRAREALGYLADEVIVRAAPAWHDALRDLGDGAARVTLVEDETVPAGFVASEAAGRVVIDATVATQLHRARERLAVSILADVAGARAGSAGAGEAP